MKVSKKDSSGTSFHGTILVCTMESLEKLLGPPQFGNNDGEGKVNCEWVCETETGKVFTIYDWKTYRPLSSTEIVEWHIGADSVRISNMALNELIESLPE